MSTEQNKALVRQMVDEIFNQGNLSQADEFLASDFAEREELPPGIPRDREGVKQLTTMLRSAFPDFKATIDDIVAEGDKVVARVTMTGTHTGDFWGVPPTGRQVNLTAIYIVRIAGGKIVEHWGEEDGMKVFRQLGFRLKLEEITG